MSTIVRVPPPQASTINNVLLMIADESPGSSALTAKDGRRTEKCACPFSLALNVQMDMLGYSYTETVGSSGYSLKRVVPLRHPLYSNYYCTHIEDEHGLQFNGTYDSPAGKGAVGVMQQGANYNYSIFNATFEPSRLYYAPDSASLPEYNRYISYEYEGRAEFIERPNGQMVFTAGPGATTPPFVYQGRTVSLEQKADFQVSWWQVPEDWVSKNGVGQVGFPTKIFAGIGCVNTGLMWGNFAAGTLLMLKPKILRYPCPLLAQNAGNLPTQTFYLDIQFNFAWFDPAPSNTGTDYKARGWNTKPWFTGEAGTQMNYYPVVAAKPGATAGSPPVPSTVPPFAGYDFTKMFSNVNAP